MRDGAQPPAVVWGPWATALSGVLVAVLFVTAQTGALALYVLALDPDLTRHELLLRMQSMPLDGLALSVVTCASTLVCVPLLAVLAKWKQGASLRAYFALAPVRWRTLAGWLGILVAFLVVMEWLLALAGRPPVAEFMLRVLEQPGPLWLLVLALVVLAPLFEESFFRGFLYAGFASSRIGRGGAVAVTALLFAVIHQQYDLIDRAEVFAIGLLLGVARVRSGSLFVPLVLHGTLNLLSFVESEWLR